jgi:hypothetical protein
MAPPGIDFPNHWLNHCWFSRLNLRDLLTAKSFGVVNSFYHIHEAEKGPPQMVINNGCPSLGPVKVKRTGADN